MTASRFALTPWPRVFPISISDFNLTKLSVTSASVRKSYNTHWLLRLDEITKRPSMVTCLK
jgi:hypothetical protein